VVEGLTFLINSSNFADDIVLYYVCIRGGSGWGVQKFDCKGTVHGVACGAKNFGVLIFKVALSTLILNHSPQCFFIKEDDGTTTPPTHTTKQGWKSVTNDPW
jgi:hypothetical protein